MPFPLVLKTGNISEELPGEVGTYPYLHIVGGALVAGGAGNKLKLVSGSIVEYTDVINLLFWETLWDLGTPDSSVGFDQHFLLMGA